MSFGWQVTPIVSGLLERLEKDGYDAKKFSEPEMKQLIAIYKAFTNARTLKAFAVLLLFLGLVFVLGDGLVKAISIFLIATSFPCYLIGRKLGIKNSQRYKTFTKTLPPERRLSPS